MTHGPSDPGLAPGTGKGHSWKDGGNPNDVRVDGANVGAPASVNVAWRRHRWVKGTRGLSVLASRLSCASKIISRLKVVFKVARENKHGEGRSLSNTDLRGGIGSEEDEPGCSLELNLLLENRSASFSLV